jgi:hypothetical protein
VSQNGNVLPDDSSVMNYDDDDEGFIDDIRGYFQHIKEELPSSSISKWGVEDKLVIKITNFLKEESITNDESYYIIMERLQNNPEQEDKG